MDTMVPNRLTRIQVQEKFKKNFQALCARCPQLGKNNETLDDSLTSLQWLWNLNVNINNPMEQKGKNGPPPRNGGLLPPFPKNFIESIDSNSTKQAINSSQGLGSPIKLEFGNKGTSSHSTKPPLVKPAGQVTTGPSRALSRNGRKTSAHVIGRPNPPSKASEPDRAYSLSAGAVNIYRRAATNPTQINSQTVGKLEPTADFASFPETATNDAKDADVVRVKLDSPSTTILPQIQSLNLEFQDNNESLLSEASTSRHYSFSPREATLDLLPGQVDYKNNPYVKPAFSFTTLICMALQNCKRHRMTFPAICKWITDNFMYYRYADAGWQNYVKMNLTQSKYFSKVHKKKDSSSKSCLWEINQSCNVKLQDINLPVSSDTPTRHSPRLGPVSNQISPASSIAISNLQSMVMLDPEDSLSLAGRKRKQASPQKVVRRRSANAKKRRNNSKSAGNHNLLQEEAPELGSLKGDFNWNSIFDEFFGTSEAELSVTPTSLPSRPSTNEGVDHQDVVGHFTEDVVSGSLLAHDMLILPDDADPGVNDENHTVASSSNELANNSSPWKPPVDNQNHSRISNPSREKPSTPLKLPLIKNSDLDEFTAGDESTEFDSINGFLKDVSELDLTITGRQIEPPAEWVPVCPELDAILCEKQNHLFGRASPSSSDIDDLMSTSASPQLRPEKCLSPQMSQSRGRTRMLRQSPHRLSNSPHRDKTFTGHGQILRRS